MSFSIQGLGTALPAHGLSQVDATEVAQSICCESEQQRRTLETLYRRTGIRHRYSVACAPNQEREDLDERLDVMQYAGADAVSVATQPAARTAALKMPFFPPAVNADDCGPTTSQRMEMYEQYAGSLAAEAATLALDRSPFRPDEITHLVTVSCTGFSAPGVDLSLIRDCGLSPTVARTHIGFMGCHGSINGLRVAKALAESDPAARVLLCAVELCTLHQQYGWQIDRVVSNALFGDGAAAIVGSASAPAGVTRPKVAATGSTIVPETEELMKWRVRDHGFEMTLSSQVPDVINASLRPWLCDWLGRHQLSLSDIGGWAIHPGGPKILKACGNTLGFENEQLNASLSILAEYGNMSSPTVLFILQRLLDEGTSLPFVMLAFGPGLTIEAALIV